MQHEKHDLILQCHKQQLSTISLFVLMAHYNMMVETEERIHKNKAFICLIGTKMYNVCFITYLSISYCMQYCLFPHVCG